MPTISRFFGISIAMYFDDHPRPHFHAAYGEHEAKVAIDTIEVLAGSLPQRQRRMVLAWAEIHQEELRANWERARARGILEPIPPLR